MEYNKPMISRNGESKPAPPFRIPDLPGQLFLWPLEDKPTDKDEKDEKDEN